MSPLFVIFLTIGLFYVLAQPYRNKEEERRKQLAAWNKKEEKEEES